MSHYNRYSYNNKKSHNRKYSSHKNNRSKRQYQYNNNNNNNNYYNNSQSSSRKRRNNNLTHITPYHPFFQKHEINSFYNKTERHLSQNPNYEKIEKSFTIEMRKLQENDKRRSYYSRKSKGEKLSVNHWGQRKLLMSEIEFLNVYEMMKNEENTGSEEKKKKKVLVVYSGAAPGRHIKFLSDLFSEYKFLLVDPSDFECIENERIEIKQEYFTNEMAKELYEKYNNNEKEYDILFISDIRTANHRIMKYEENEKQIAVDMNLQKEWVEILKPKLACLKFRLPYFNKKSYDHNSTFEYLDGEIFFPVWGRQSTTECRLICDGSGKKRDYNIQKFEEQMFFFNSHTRVQYYEHDIESKGLDHCFDCRSEVFILENYLKTIKNIQVQPDLKSEIEKLIPIVSKECSTSGRDLLYIEPTQGSFLTNEEYEYEKKKTGRIIKFEPLRVKKKVPKLVKNDNEDEMKVEVDLNKELIAKRRKRFMKSQNEKSGKNDDKQEIDESLPQMNDEIIKKRKKRFENDDEERKRKRDTTSDDDEHSSKRRKQN